MGVPTELIRLAMPLTFFYQPERAARPVCAYIKINQEKETLA